MDALRSSYTSDSDISEYSERRSLTRKPSGDETASLSNIPSDEDSLALDDSSSTRGNAWMRPLRRLNSKRLSWMNQSTSRDPFHEEDPRPMVPLVVADKTSSPTSTKSTLRDQIVKYVMYSYSLALLGWVLQLITSGILAERTPIAKEARPIATIVIMWVLILWLGILEGGQGCLVGLQPVEKSQYKDSHPISHQCTTMAHEGENLNRFIVGRQFFVVIVVFFLNLVATAVPDPPPPPGVGGMPPPPHPEDQSLGQMLLMSGLAVMLVTVILGQLSAEVNATNCMLDFINNRLVLVTTWFCLAIEASGLLHSVYLVQCLFPTKRAVVNKDGKQDASSSKIVKRNTTQQVWYWVRVAFSTSLLAGALVITIEGLLNSQTTMCKGLPKILSLGIFAFLTCFLGVLEAMQIAVFAVVKLPGHALHAYPTARSNAQLVFRGRNFKAFLIGRQICVTTSMFLLARISTTDVKPLDDTVLGIPRGLQDFFNTGLPGALITTIVASLFWRIIAASFPIPFMNNLLVTFIIKLCLALEASGVFSASWLLSDGIKWAIGLQTDDVYLTDVPNGHGGGDEELGSIKEVVTPQKQKIPSSAAYGSTEDIRTMSV